MVNTARHFDRLICPHCRAPVTELPGSLQCVKCDRVYPVEGSWIQFLPDAEVWQVRRNWSFGIKKQLRHLPPIW